MPPIIFGLRQLYLIKKLLHGKVNYLTYRNALHKQLHKEPKLFGDLWSTEFSVYIQSLSIEISQNAFLRDACPITCATTFSKIPSMSTMRTPLGPINWNITRGKELRNKICALAENGHDIPFIIGRYKVSRGTVRYTLDHQASRPETNTSAPRPGAKKTYNYLDERNLLRYAR
jgi:hypothetical protein